MSSVRWRTSRKLRWTTAVAGLAALYVALVPSVAPLSSFDLYNDKRLLQVGLLLTTGAILLLSPSARRQWLGTFRTLPLFARWGLGAVLSLGLVSAVMAPAPGYAVLEIGHFVLLFVLAGVVATVVRQSPTRAGFLLLGAVVLSAGLYAVHFGVSYGMSVALPALEVGRESISGFANIRHFNQYQTWTLPILVGGIIALPRQWRVSRSVVFVLAALWWTLVFASNVRGTVVAMIIAAVGMWLLFRKRAHRWLGVQVAALLAGGALYYVLFTQSGGTTPQVVERLGDVGQGRRLQHWAKCLDMAWTHPWLGVGPMHYAWPPYDFAPAAHPHNAFMQWLAEWGIPSTAIMSGLTIWGGWRWMQREKNEAETGGTCSHAVRVALVASVLAGAAHAMVSGIIVMPLSQMMLVLVGGWAWGRYRHEETPSDSAPSRWAHVVLCVVILGSMGVVGSSLQDLGTIEERRTAFLEAVDRNAFSPRYWQQGYIGVRDSSVIERARIEW